METLVTAWALWKVYKCVSTVYSTYRTGMYFYNTTVAIYGTTRTMIDYIVGPSETARTPTGDYIITKDDGWEIVTPRDSEFELLG